MRASHIRHKRSSELIVVALAGYPRSGKDTVVDILREVYPTINIYKVAFADELKIKHLEVLDDIPTLEVYNKYLHDELVWEGGCLRTELDLFSKKILEVDPKAWVNLVKNRIANLKDIDLVIITDLRYPIEYEYITNYCIPAIRVIRGTPPQDIKDKSWNKHIEAFTYDAVINNNGTMEDLSSRCVNVFSKLNPIRNTGSL